LCWHEVQTATEEHDRHSETFGVMVEQHREIYDLLDIQPNQLPVTTRWGKM
jgi:hypothetical protein